MDFLILKSYRYEETINPYEEINNSTKYSDGFYSNRLNQRAKKE